MAIENTMAQLAHSQVSQSLPSLANDLQGFQIIESNESNNTAIGVVVALIGDLCIYVPVIYRKGKIYNVDIMYVPEMRQWLPTQDNWVTYLRSRRSDLEAVIKERDAVTKKGKPASIDLKEPFLKIVKTASEQTSDTLLDTAKAIMTEELKRKCDDFDIPDSLTLLTKCASSEAAQKMLNTLANNDVVGDVFVQFYTNEELLNLADKVAEEALKPRDKVAPVGEVKLMTAASAGATELTDEQKAKILRDGAVVVDTRGILPSRVYKVKSKNSWCNPSENGVYQLLKEDGKQMTAYVICNSEMTDNGKDYCYFVIPLNDGLARQVYKIQKDIMGQPVPFAELPGNVGISVSGLPSNGGLGCIAIHDNQAVDLTGTIVLKTKNVDGLVSYSVTGACANTLGNSGSCGRYEAGKEFNTIVQIPAAGKIKLVGDVLYLPEGCRLVNFNSDYEGKNKLPLMTQSEYMTRMGEINNLRNIKVFNTNDSFVISDDLGKATDPLTKLAAAKELVEDYVFDPNTAMEILNEVKPNTQKRFLAKIAASPMMGVSTGDSSDFDTGEVDLTGKIKGEVSDDVKKQFEEAGKLNIKEVMDVTTLKMLAEDGSSVRMIQDLLPSLFSAMNAVGQILFMLRAGTSMVEAYGDARCDDMEMQFAKLMQRLGDVIIVLQNGRVNNISDLLEGPLASTLG